MKAEDTFDIPDDAWSPSVLENPELKSYLDVWDGWLATGIE